MLTHAQKFALLCHAETAMHGNCNAPGCEGCASDRALSEAFGQAPDKAWMCSEIAAEMAKLVSTPRV